jgi:hypothetical protein
MFRSVQKHEKKELKKHSATIQIRNSISLLQRKTWNALLWNAYHELTTKDIHSMPVPEIARLVGYDSKDEQYLKDATKAMMNCIVEWDVLDKDGSEEWGAAVLLASVQIKRGICSYGFAPHLRHKLHNPEMFARLDLDMQKRFKSKHSLALWELCTDYLGAKRDYGETPWIELLTFRRLMGIEDHQYSLYKLFSQRVLSPSLDEINGVSDFRVTVEYQHRGRKITALKFKMRRVAMRPEPDSEQVSLFPELDDIPLVVKELQDAGLSTQDALEIWQKSFTFVDGTLRPVVIDGDDEAAFAHYVQEKIHLLKRRQAAGKVENSTGFLREAIKKNYANPEFAREEKRQQAAEAQRGERLRDEHKHQLERQIEDLKTACEKTVSELCDATVNAAPDILDTVLPVLFADMPFLRQYQEPGKSALENYRAARFMFKGAVNSYVERYAPERIQSVREQYTAQIAAIEAQIAALYG